ncbi:MAG: biotin-dependent carboxyltransferase family protein [Paracoccaceae bacterium]|nr:biotin-dependent carboxyltransferase family protein [Paracoccaceae bacterium]
MSLSIQRIGPAVSIQDAGRAGGMGLGLSRGGAADRLAYLAACALAGVPIGSAAIEMAGFGGRFRLEATTRIALAGTPMRATVDGAPVAWNAAHIVEAGSILDIGAAEKGVYGYLLPGGGLDTPEELGGRGFHRIAGLGRALEEGDRLPILPDPAPDAPPMRLPAPSPETGPIRVMPGPQTTLFNDDTRARFEATTFTRSAKANRQGVRLEQEGDPFSAGSQLQRVSDFISEGDIQMTGDGTPYVLLADCQTMGGYPRIGTVLPGDLPRIAQAMPGQTLRFRFVTVEEAEALWISDADTLKRLKKSLMPLVRDPRAMTDLLTYELIGKPLSD